MWVSGVDLCTARPYNRKNESGSLPLFVASFDIVPGYAHKAPEGSGMKGGRRTETIGKDGPLKSKYGSHTFFCVRNG